MRVRKNWTALVIVPYFGSWPSYTRYFLSSLGKQSSIHFLLIGDHDLDSDLPENCLFSKTSLSELAARFSEKLEMSVALARPYKICDFRPAFGYLFEEHLPQYEYWGWCDVDLVFGDVFKFLNFSRIEYDVISGLPGRTAGPFTLVRNVEKLNQLFRRSEHLREIFATDVGFAFDESGRFRDRRTESFSHLVAKLYARNDCRVLHRPLLKDSRSARVNGEYRWDSVTGELTELASGRSVFAYHFNEKTPGFQVNDGLKSFIIGPKGFRHAESGRRRYLSETLFSSGRDLWARVRSRSLWAELASEHFAR